MLQEEFEDPAVVQQDLTPKSSQTQKLELTDQLLEEPPKNIIL